ncbi:hypothetical protein [Okeania sp. KiyG1]|nr:hypothetical protein [Okeania sp. KiyG1]
MVETVQTQTINFLGLKLKFGLERTDDGEFCKHFLRNAAQTAISGQLSAF